ncbi:penicillin-binding transpeptidase domain-containing protein [Bacillus salipaludis]|uniref:serine-type D-Ala-D-Ala carboxypeptidase n=1 Tax=Bacillus salipaludis TaxID=2547811 RepID=A0A4R5VZL1_9BACI|nr:penicillin-binding transpeptidase domain-containing protein [Bacillus salipaludis]MDQ6595110.1 penicillin-binding transpeptidase domain-containing protein [Bacillus salipaludis]TDK64028.1 penicillin-binding transpeptidase domain-containing protein [Bacillus salipaludis]
MKKLIGVLLLGFVIILAGCNKEPAPQDRFAAYIKLWNQQKFDQMYDYLSTSAKKSISKEEFTSRYEKIYKDLQITDLKVNFKKPKEDKQADEEKATYSFNAKMNSVAGPINFTYKAKLKKEEKDDKKNWYVDWNTGFIFPKLQKGDKIGLSTTSPERGEILDRNGNGLAVNGDVMEVGVVPGKMGDKKAQIVAQLAKLLDISKEQIEQDLGAGWVKPELFVPLRRIPLDDHKTINQLMSIQSVVTKDVPARIYPYKEAAAQLVGYVGAITADELKELESKGYTAQDLVGKRGLEQVYDQELKGQTGVKITIKKNGKEEVLAEKPVENGKRIKLTIDAELQASIYDEMQGDAGTAGAMNPTTGETLALVSSPSFDPNQASLGFSASEWKALQSNKKMPLTTRFKQTYAPGSVMKPITAAIALENKAITPGQSVAIKGLKWQKSKSWGGYYVTRVHEASPVNLEKAFVYSDNIYFAQAALKTGRTAFVDGLKKFGFEKEQDYPFPLEKPTIGSLGSEISLADSGYGQGQIQMNIVSLMDAYTPLVNSGNMIKPILLAGDKKSQVLQEQAMTPDAVATIAPMLRKVVTDPGGTARAANIPGYPLAGKTGTAEIKQKQGELGTQNGWFIAYNPKKPNLMMAMMIENVEKRGGSQVPVKKLTKVFKMWK